MLKFRSGDFQPILTFRHTWRAAALFNRSSFHTSLKQYPPDQFINRYRGSYFRSYTGTLIPVCKWKLKLGRKKSGIGEIEENGLSGKSNRKIRRENETCIFGVLVSHVKPQIYPSNNHLLRLFLTANYLSLISKLILNILLSCFIFRIFGFWGKGYFLKKKLFIFFKIIGGWVMSQFNVVL